jgi:hypothetical protein
MGAGFEPVIGESPLIQPDQDPAAGSALDPRNRQNHLTDVARATGSFVGLSIVFDQEHAHAGAGQAASSNINPVGTK